jgi:hypothetical protein
MSGGKHERYDMQIKLLTVGNSGENAWSLVVLGVIARNAAIVCWLRPTLAPIFTGLLCDPRILRRVFPYETMSSFP